MSRSTTTSAPKATQSQAQSQSNATTQMCPPPDKVAARAFEKWVKKGCKHGQDQQDWLEAEAELKAEMARAPKK